jgi:hypothetical protein
MRLSLLSISSTAVLDDCPFAVMMARFLEARPCQGSLSRVAHTVSFVRPVGVGLTHRTRLLRHERICVLFVDQFFNVGLRQRHRGFVLWPLRALVADKLWPNQGKQLFVTQFCVSFLSVDSSHSPLTLVLVGPCERCIALVVEAVKFCGQCLRRCFRFNRHVCRSRVIFCPRAHRGAWGCDAMSITVVCGWLAFRRLSPAAFECPLDKHLEVVSGPTSWLGETYLLQELAFDWLGEIVLRRLSLLYNHIPKLSSRKTYIHTT